MKREAAKIDDMRAVLGEAKIPKGIDILEEMPYNKEWMRYVNLDYARRKRLINHPEMKLPHADIATIADEKFTKYLYNPNNARGWAKGRGIASRLGYDETNWKDFKEVIDSNKDKFPVKYTRNNGYDDLYEQMQVIYGLNGKPANVLVSWAVNENGTHMTSVYLKEI
jgi:hypothetical protein